MSQQKNTSAKVLDLKKINIQEARTKPREKNKSAKVEVKETRKENGKARRPKNRASFYENAVPSEKEIKREEIDESLKEIYQNEDGSMVNVKKMDIKRRHGFFYYFFVTLLTLFILGGAGWGYYKYFYLKTNANYFNLEINGPKEIVSGKEFTYTVNYNNLSNVSDGNLDLKLTYPDNFIFISSDPAANSKNNDEWTLNDLGAHRGGLITITGEIMGPQNEVGNLLAEIVYTPSNISSEFKKDASYQTVVTGTGLDFEINSDESVLANEQGTIAVKFKGENENYIDHFRLSVAGSANFQLATTSDSKDPDIQMVRPGIWDISKVGTDEKELDIGFKFPQKISPTETVTLNCEYDLNGVAYNFFQQNINFEIIKNDLNLNLILNGSRNDQGINFGDTLNYSIVYSNKGESEMKNVVIMAVLNGDILDWGSFTDQNKGNVNGDTITWTQNEIPGLASLAPGTEGTIDFTINVLGEDKIKSDPSFDPSKDYNVESFAQFSIGGEQATTSAGVSNANAAGVNGGSNDTKSNTITAKLNSDLGLNEQVRYFNSDNIAVGSGPLPPKVGNTTSFRVFWDVSNNLHELSDLKVETTLPNYVSWNNDGMTNLGSLSFDSTTHTVTWNIGRLPTGTGAINAQFGISITPTQNDANKILVLVPGSTITAMDTVTGTEINKTTKAQTTKLETDDIANTDGIITN